MRIGNGYDVHRLVEGRKLILGGIEINHEKGLLGHSDADVLVHAIMDAMLGALALGDIGQHFPDTDEKYKGISSIELLKEVNNLIKNQGYKISNLDSQIACQRPKLKPHIILMRVVCALLECSLYCRLCVLLVSSLYYCCMGVPCDLLATC